MAGYTTLDLTLKFEYGQKVMMTIIHHASLLIQHPTYTAEWPAVQARQATRHRQKGNVLTSKFMAIVFSNGLNLSSTKLPFEVFYYAKKIYLVIIHILRTGELYGEDDINYYECEKISNSKRNSWVGRSPPNKAFYMVHLAMYNTVVKTKRSTIV